MCLDSVRYNRYAEFAKERVKKIAVQPEEIPALDDAAYESVLSTDWHPFYDARGVTWRRQRVNSRGVGPGSIAGSEHLPSTPLGFQATSVNGLYRTTIVLPRILHYRTRSTTLIVLEGQGYSGCSLGFRNIHGCSILP